MRACAVLRPNRLSLEQHSSAPLCCARRYSCTCCMHTYNMYMYMLHMYMHMCVYNMYMYMLYISSCTLCRPSMEN